MTPYHDALLKCAYRYGAMAAPLVEQRLLSFIDEFENGCRKGLPVPKLCRWLGYIQGVLIDRNITTVEKERDWTRPLFRPLDFPDENKLSELADLINKRGKKPSVGSPGVLRQVSR